MSCCSPKSSDIIEPTIKNSTFSKPNSQKNNDVGLNHVDFDLESNSSSEDSDIFDDDEDSQSNDEVITNWLEVDDEVTVDDAIDCPVVNIPVMPDDEYILQNKILFLALLEVEDLNFLNMPLNKQKEFMQSLEVESYHPSQVIFEEGSYGQELYFVIGSPYPEYVGEVEVVKVQDDKTLKALTRLTRGQYFGQKYFLTKRVRQRSATVRVPDDSPCCVEVAKLPIDKFDIWELYRNMLLVKAAPLIQQLPKEELLDIIEKMTIKEYKPGEYIIRQGDQGDEFFIIREGSVKIVDETIPSLPRVLTTLKEGHFFGEMALIADEPRVASVIALDPTICLSLTKEGALSARTFADILIKEREKRQLVREQRENVNKNSIRSLNDSFRLSTSSANSGSLTPITYRNRRNSSASNSTNPSVSTHTDDQSSGGASSSSSAKTEVTETSIVHMSRIQNRKKINKYLLLKDLGKGSSGVVHLCEHEDTHKKYAMKVIDRSGPKSGQDVITENIRREIAVMKRLRHENVVSLHEVIDDPTAWKIFLIQELMEGGALMPDSENAEPIPEAQCRKYFRDIICGVSYLHAEGIIHRDLKPSNMLLTAEGRVKIADFGASVFSSGYEKAAAGGTPAYMSPELCTPNSSIDASKLPAIDVFALGATLYCMIVGRPPWMASNAIELAAKIRNIELTFPQDDKIDPHLKYLLKRMLDKDYRTRITLHEVSTDDWVTMEGSDPLFSDEFLDEDIFGHEDFNYLAIISKSHLSPTDVELKLDPSHFYQTGNTIQIPTAATLTEESTVYTHRALIIDRRPVIRKTIATQLKELGVKSKSVDSGESAVSEIISSYQRTKKTYDFILYDIYSSVSSHVDSSMELLEIPGNESKSVADLSIIKSIRGTGFTGILIVMVDTSEQGHEVKAQGGTDYVLIKPIQPEKLNHIINRSIDISNAAGTCTPTLAYCYPLTETIINEGIASIDMKRPNSQNSEKMDDLLNDLEVNDAIFCIQANSTANSTQSSPLFMSSQASDFSSPDGKKIKFIEDLRHSSNNSSMHSLALSGSSETSVSSGGAANALLATKSALDVFDEDFPKPMSLHKDTFYSSDSFTLKHETSEDNHDSHAGQKKLGNKKLTRTRDFVLIPSDIVFNEAGKRAQKSIISIGKNQSINLNRKHLREAAIRASKQLAANSGGLDDDQPVQLLTNFTPKSTTTSIDSSFFGDTYSSTKSVSARTLSQSNSSGFRQYDNSSSLSMDARDSSSSILSSYNYDSDNMSNHASSSDSSMFLSIAASLSKNNPQLSSSKSWKRPNSRKTSYARLSMTQLTTVVELPKEDSDDSSSDRKKSPKRDHNDSSIFNVNSDDIDSDEDLGCITTVDSFSGNLDIQLDRSNSRNSSSKASSKNNSKYSLRSRSPNSPTSNDSFEGNAKNGKKSKAKKNKSKNSSSKGRKSRKSKKDESDSSSHSKEVMNVISTTEFEGSIDSLQDIENSISQQTNGNFQTEESEVSSDDDGDDDDNGDVDESSEDSDNNEGLVYFDENFGLDSLVDLPHRSTGTGTLKLLNLQNSSTISLTSLNDDMNSLKSPTFDVKDESNKYIKVDEGNMNSSLGIKFSKACLMGDRPYMEDRNVIKSDILAECIDLNECSKHFSAPMAFLAVYDGHNGEETADTLAMSFHTYLVNFFQRQRELSSDSNNSSDLDTPKESLVSLGMRHVCNQIDMEVLQRDYLRQLENQEKKDRQLSVFNQKYAGSVGVMMSIYLSDEAKDDVNVVINSIQDTVDSHNLKNDIIEPRKQIRMTIANVGDCRAVLCNNQGLAVQLTTDHKPNLPEEKSRIEASGGFVNKNRVSGILAVSRSFGDLPYKLMEVGKNQEKDYLQLQRQVISDPQIIEFDVTSEHYFIILGCDGLWDVMTNQQAVDYVRKQLKKHSDLDIVTKKLVQKALNDGSSDNITAIICMLNQY